MLCYQAVPFPSVPKVPENTQINLKQELSQVPKYHITYNHRIPCNIRKVAMGYPNGIISKCHGIPPCSLLGTPWVTPMVLYPSVMGYPHRLDTSATGYPRGLHTVNA